MTNAWFDDDDLLAAELGAALAEGRDVPARLVEIGKGALAWRSVDADLAALSFDSAVAGAGANLRSDTAALRTLSFAGDRLTIELELTADALLGQVVPPEAGEVELQRREGAPLRAAANAVGWFAIRPRPTGMFRLRFTDPDGHATVTAWITG